MQVHKPAQKLYVDGPEYDLFLFSIYNENLSNIFKEYFCYLAIFKTLTCNLLIICGILKELCTFGSLHSNLSMLEEKYYFLISKLGKYFESKLQPNFAAVDLILRD